MVGGICARRLAKRRLAAREQWRLCAGRAGSRAPAFDIGAPGRETSGRDPHFIPREGIDHAVFADVAPGDATELMLTFAAPLEDAALASLQGLVNEWVETFDWTAVAGGRPSFAVDSDGQSLRLGFIGVRHPQPPVRALLERLAATELGLREVFFCRRTVDDEGVPGVAVADPLAPDAFDYEDSERWWDACFNPTVAPPLREDVAGTYAVLEAKDGSVLVERRGMPLYFPEARLAYGLADAADADDVDDSDRARRSIHVRDALVRGLETSFANQRPTLFNREGEADGAIDCIARGGRRGYAFAVLRDEMMALYPSTFRYREYELLHGVCRAVAELELAPVVHWDRDRVYVVNIWEPS